MVQAKNMSWMLSSDVDVADCFILPTSTKSTSSTQLKILNNT